MSPGRPQVPVGLLLGLSPCVLVTRHAIEFLCRNVVKTVFIRVLPLLPFPGRICAAVGGRRCLLAQPVRDERAKRFWSEAYLVLTGTQPQDLYGAKDVAVGNPDGRLVNWISSQSVPEMLPPQSAGAIRSELLTLLVNDHYGVSLSREELDKIACWIDLLVPFCGDYTEANAWTAAERSKYQHFLTKRQRMEALERDSIASLQSAPTRE